MTQSMDFRCFRFVSEVEASTEEEGRRKRPKGEHSHVSTGGSSSSPPTKDPAPAAAGSDSATRSDTELPPSPKRKPAGSDLCPRYGSSLVCGLRRDMEDTVSVHPCFFRRGPDAERLHFFGVFDGHGCSHVAKSCKEQMHRMLREELEGLGWATDWTAAMERSFSSMDDAAVISSRGGAPPPPPTPCRCELQIPKCNHVGSTAVVAVVAPDRIVVGNCGDSRAVLCRRGVAIALSVDHKPDRPDELERIIAAGGRVIYWGGARVMGVLAMSRAIGDWYLKPLVTSKPEVTVTERTLEDECLILASDGLWDVLTNEMASDVARMCLRSSPPVGEGADRACKIAALLLTKMALARGTSDNVSVVVIDLRAGARSVVGGGCGDGHTSQ